jgi:hypothetical protein
LRPILDIYSFNVDHPTEIGRLFDAEGSNRRGEEKMLREKANGTLAREAC